MPVYGHIQFALITGEVTLFHRDKSLWQRPWPAETDVIRSSSTINKFAGFLLINKCLDWFFNIKKNPAHYSSKCIGLGH